MSMPPWCNEVPSELGFRVGTFVINQNTKDLGFIYRVDKYSIHILQMSKDRYNKRFVGGTSTDGWDIIDDPLELLADV